MDTIEDITLGRQDYRFGDEKIPTFAMEAWTSEGDTVWIGQNEEDLSKVEYVLASAAEGDIYYNTSLTLVIRELTKWFEVPRNLLEEIADYAEEFIYL